VISARPVVLALAAVLVALLPACSGAQSPSSAPAGAAQGAAVPSSGAKVLVVVFERQNYSHVMGSGLAPYLDQLATTYGTALHMDAGYDRSCPGLPGYLLMTSGDTHKVCDDKGPWAHRILGPSIFGQVAAKGRSWRVYAEGMSGSCARRPSKDGRFPARHAFAAYYAELRSTCATRQLPLGRPDEGALHDDVAAGTLPAYGMVLPDVCHGMYGGKACKGSLVRTGDLWLARWLNVVLHGPDWESGKLVVVVTWNQGSDADNHIPTLVLSPRTTGVRVTDALTHCSLLRMEQDLLGLTPLGCARTALSPLGAFHLAG
jgi:phosphatidylinositol-3-phosphatase